MEIGRFQVQIVVVIGHVVFGVMLVSMSMIAVMSAPKDAGRDEVDDQAQRRDQQRFLVLDALSLEQPLDLAVDHQRQDAHQEDRARKAAEHLDLPGAERVPGIVGMLEPPSPYARPSTSAGRWTFRRSSCPARWTCRCFTRTPASAPSSMRRA